MINKVILIGNLGKDPEFKTIQGRDGERSVAKFSLATSENYRGKDGEWQQKTEWHNVVAWAWIADKVKEYRKGETVYLEGKLTYRTYETQGGEKKYITEVVADYIRLLKRNDQQEGTRQGVTATDDQVGDLPF